MEPLFGFLIQMVDGLNFGRNDLTDCPNITPSFGIYKIIAFKGDYL
jgi:hypothetical protein